MDNQKPNDSNIKIHDTRDITKEAHDGKLDPVIGRDSENRRSHSSLK